MNIPSIITKRSVPRRTVLRGLGATLALPLLDCMLPALKAAPKSARRLGVVYKGLGASPPYWAPKKTGSGFEFTETLEPLAPFRDRLLVLSGLDNAPAHALAGEPTGGHARLSGSFLSAVHAKATDGADFRAGVTMDQMAAAHLGRQTELRSLELQLGSNQLAGSCDGGYSCSYVNTLSWSTPTTPLMMENNPRVIFERLFGDSGTTNEAVRAARRRRDRSLLDSVGSEVQDFIGKLGPDDRIRIDQYLDGVRDVERRIQTAEAQHKSDVTMPVLEAPAGIPSAWADHCKLMIDLQILAFQADLTRVITFMMVKELSSQAYPETGLPDAHHQLSHHMDDPESLAKLAIYDNYHVTKLAYYLEKLQATKDGDGSLLDNSLILYCSAHSNPNAHDPRNLPLVLIGGKDRFSGGRHIRYAEGTPVANLYKTILGKLDVPVERIGDSTGEVEL